MAKQFKLFIVMVLYTPIDPKERFNCVWYICSGKMIFNPIGRSFVFDCIEKKNFIMHLVLEVIQ